MKDAQATGEAFDPQKRTSSTSNMNFFTLLFVILSTTLKNSIILYVLSDNVRLVLRKAVTAALQNLAFLMLEASLFPGSCHVIFLILYLESYAMSVRISSLHLISDPESDLDPEPDRVLFLQKSFRIRPDAVPDQQHWFHLYDICEFQSTSATI
jgi:hypothetical protein